MWGASGGKRQGPVGLGSISWAWALCGLIPFAGASQQQSVSWGSGEGSFRPSREAVCFLGSEKEHKMGKVRRSAASSRDNIRWYFAETDNLHDVVPQNKTIVAIETADNATCIYDTELPEDIAFVVGNESKGLDESLLSQCDMVVYIPVPGPTRSLNVSQATAVVLFEWQRQMLKR